MSNENPRQTGFQSRTPTLNDPRDPKSPGRRASDLIEEIDSTCYRWAARMVWRHHYVISAPINVNPIGYTHTTSDYCTFLAAHVTELAKDEYIGELCESLRGYANRAVGGREEGGLLNRRIPDRFLGPCPTNITDHSRCKHPPEGSCVYRAHNCATALMARPGVLEVTCTWCGAVHGAERLRINLLAWADKHRGTIPEIYDVMWQLGERVKLNTLWHWANPKKGNLKPAGYLRADGRRIVPTRHSDKDTPVYLISDVRKMRADKLKPSHRGPPLNKKGQ